MEINVLLYYTCAKTVTARDNRKASTWGSSERQQPMAEMSYSRDPQYLKDIKWFNNRVLYSFFFLNIPKVRSGYAIWWHFRFSDTFLQTRSNKFCTGKKKKILASDTVSLFISINICFKADPPQYDKNASLFSQQSYSSLPCFIHKQSESSPFIYGYVWNAPKVMTSMLGNKNTTLTQFREEEIQLQLTALFSYGLCNTESFICMCQTRCKTNPSHSAHSS